jgi:hypothetical protein
MSARVSIKLLLIGIVLATRTSTLTGFQQFQWNHQSFAPTTAQFSNSNSQFPELVSSQELTSLASLVSSIRKASVATLAGD